MVCSAIILCALFLFILFQHVAHSMSSLFKAELESPLKCGQANTDFTLRGVLEHRGRGGTKRGPKRPLFQGGPSLPSSN